MAQVIIGLDPHKASNTIAVVEQDETILARHRFPNSEIGLVEMLDFVAGHGERMWAVEGAHGIGRAVAQWLIRAGELVVDVPAKLATRVRVYSTGHGSKSDDHDALSIARAAVHSRHLRRVVADDETVALKLLSDRRDELSAQRTQSVCRLHRLIRELVPGGTARRLTANRASALVNSLDVEGPADEMRVELALDHIEDLRRLDARLREVTKQITQLVEASKTTLTRVFGIGPLGAATIMAEIGNIGRFPTRNHLASYAGTAPLEVSSGEIARHRLSRSGNRRLNQAIHMIAITQARFDTPGRDYYQRKLASGKSPREARRCLKRRITDVIWRQLQLDRQFDQTQDDDWPRWTGARGSDRQRAYRSQPKPAPSVPA